MKNYGYPMKKSKARMTIGSICCWIPLPSNLGPIWGYVILKKYLRYTSFRKNGSKSAVLNFYLENHFCVLIAFVIIICRTNFLLWLLLRIVINRFTPLADLAIGILRQLAQKECWPEKYNLLYFIVCNYLNGWQRIRTKHNRNSCWWILILTCRRLWPVLLPGEVQEPDADAAGHS